MDSATHLVLGISLGGLATALPPVAQAPDLVPAIMIACIAGQQAPDLDTLCRLRGNTVYVRHHRGLTHSIPALFIWTGLISVAVQLIFGFDLPWLPLMLWTFIAVILHVFVDLFNTYGTQALRPFSPRWVAWHIIPTFDPVIFSLLATAIVMWLLHLGPAGLLFGLAYGLVAVYYVWRCILRRRILKQLPDADKSAVEGDTYLLMPTYSLAEWNVVRMSRGETYTIGHLSGNHLTWDQQVRAMQHPAIDHSRATAEVQTLLYFSAYAVPTVKKHPLGYEVQWYDVRFMHRNQYPFVAAILMDPSYTPLSSYLGWRRLEKVTDRLEKRLT
jgi:inner membrane protein